MYVKGNWGALVGQTIEAVVVTGVDVDHHDRNPKAQVHLVFSDESTFEIFGGYDLGGGSRRYRGNLAEVLGYLGYGWEIKVFGQVPTIKPEQNSE